LKIKTLAIKLCFVGIYYTFAQSDKQRQIIPIIPLKIPLKLCVIAKAIIYGFATVSRANVQNPLDFLTALFCYFKDFYVAATFYSFASSQ